MKRVKAIVLDIDGCIVGEKIGFNSPNPHFDVISKMKEVKEKGVKIILCTAKPHFAIRSIIDGAGLDNPHITDGGGVLISPIKDKILKQYIIDNEQAKQVLKACLNNNIYVEVYTTRKYIIQESQISDITNKHTHILQTEPEAVTDLLAINEEITKIMPVVNGEKGKGTFTALFNALNTDLTLSWGVHPVALPLQFGIITAKGISKRQGALDILSNLKVDVDETLGVGDSTSDWQFIEAVKFGAAMKNASRELKDLVSSKGQGNFLIGGHVDDNGIIEIFDYFI